LLSLLIYDNLTLMKTGKQEEKKEIVYEIGCLFVPIISDKDVLTEVSNVKELLIKLGFEFLSGDGPKMRDLAYPMKKAMAGKKNLFEKAYFVWLKFMANSDKLANLKKDLDKNENILRYILIKTVKKDILISEQKKTPSRISTEGKEQKIIKPAKVLKTEDPSTVEVLKESEEVERDLDDTIDKLVIK